MSPKNQAGYLWGGKVPGPWPAGWLTQLTLRCLALVSCPWSWGWSHGRPGFLWFRIFPSWLWGASGESPFLGGPKKRGGVGTAYQRGVIFVHGCFFFHYILVFFFWMFPSIFLCETMETCVVFLFFLCGHLSTHPEWSDQFVVCFQKLDPDVFLSVTQHL